MMKLHYCHPLQEGNYFRKKQQVVKIIEKNMSKYLHEGAIGSQKIAEIIDLQSGNMSAGGHSIFLGQVRNDKITEKEVQAIEYSAYPGMIDKQADKLCNHILQKYQDVQNIYILHSTGKVYAGEKSLFVMICGGHRIETQNACIELVELIKKELPVWKKEIFEDDSYQWTDNTI